MNLIFNKQSVSWLLLFSMIFNTLVPANILPLQNETELPGITIEYEDDEESPHHMPHTSVNVEMVWGTGANAASMVATGDTLRLYDLEEGQNPLTGLRLAAHFPDPTVEIASNWTQLGATIPHGITVSMGGANSNTFGGTARSFGFNSITIPDMDALEFLPVGSGYEATLTITFNPSEAVWGANVTASNLYLVIVQTGEGNGDGGSGDNGGGGNVGGGGGNHTELPEPTPGANHIRTTWGTGGNTASLQEIGNTLFLSNIQEGTNDLASQNIRVAGVFGSLSGNFPWGSLNPTITPQGVAVTMASGNNGDFGTGNARSFAFNTITIPDMSVLDFVPDGNGGYEALITITFSPNANWGSVEDNTANNLRIIIESGEGSGVQPGPVTATISQNQALNLAPRLLPLDPVAANVTWESTNPAVATVDATGLVFGVSAGTTTIRAVDASDATNYNYAEVTVTALSPHHVAMNWAYLNTAQTALPNIIPAPMDFIVAREGQEFYAVVNMEAQGDLGAIQGSGAGWMMPQLSGWFGNETVAGSRDGFTTGVTISDFTRYSVVSNGMFRANFLIEEGTVNFTTGEPYTVLTLYPRPQHTAWGTGFQPTTPLNIRVVNPAYNIVDITNITLNHVTYELVISEDYYPLEMVYTVQLVATTTPANPTMGELAWGSSDTSVATVDQNGLVTGVGNGTATIVARSLQNAGQEVTMEVTVLGAREPEIYVTSVTLAPQTATLILGDEPEFYSPHAQPSWWGTPAPAHPFWDEQDHTDLLQPRITLEWVTDRYWTSADWTTNRSQNISAVNWENNWNFTGQRGDTIHIPHTGATRVSMIYSAENVLQPNTFSTNANHNPAGLHRFWSTPNTGINTFLPAVFGSGTIAEGNFTFSGAGGFGMVGDAQGFRTEFQSFGYLYRVVTFTLTPTPALRDRVIAEGPQIVPVQGMIPFGIPGTQADWRPSGTFPTNTIYVVVSEDAPALGPDQPNSPVITDDHIVRLQSQVQPANATNQALTWESSDPAIATVVGGIVTGLTPGVVTITARSVANPAIYATSTIRVMYPAGPDLLPDRTITHQFIWQHSLDLFAGGTTDYMDAFFYSKPDHLVPGTEEFDYYLGRIENGPRADGRNLNITWSSSDDSIVTVTNSTDPNHPERAILTPVGILPPDAARGYSFATITASVNVNGQVFSADTQVRVYQPNGTTIVYLPHINQLGTVNGDIVEVLAISGGQLTNANVMTIVGGNTVQGVIDAGFPNIRELYIIGTASIPARQNANSNANGSQWFRGIGFDPHDPIDPDYTRGNLRRLVIYNTEGFGNDFFRDSVSLEYLYLRHTRFLGTRAIAMPQHSQSSRLHTVRQPVLEHITFRTWYYNTVLSTLELGWDALHIERPAANAGLWFSFSSLGDVMREVWPEKPYFMTVFVPDYAAFREFTRMEADEANPGPFLPGQLSEEIPWVVLPFDTLNGENLPEIETHPPFVDEYYDWLQEFYRVDLPFDNRQIPISLNFFTFAQHLTVQNSWFRPISYYYAYIPSLGGNLDAFVLPQVAGQPGPPYGLTIFDVMIWAKQAGYEGLDITGYYLEGYQGMRLQTAAEMEFMLYQAREIRRFAELLDIEITGTGFGNSFTDANAERVRMDIERYKFFLHVADAMGAPVIRVFAGNVPADEIQLGWHHIITERLIPAIVELSEYATYNGFDVQLGIQNHGDIIATENQALYLMHRLNSMGIHNVGLVQDTGFWRGYQSLQSNFYDWYSAINATLPISNNFQLKKKPAGAGTAAGWLDLDRVFRDIRLSGYTGTVPIELLWGGAGIDNDLHLSPDPRITLDNLPYWEAQFGRSTAQRAANEAAWFLELTETAERRSLDSNMDIATILGEEVAIVPTNRTVTSPVSGETRSVFGAGTLADPRVRAAEVVANRLTLEDVLAAHEGATVSMYSDSAFTNSVTAIDLEAGVNNVYVRVISYNRYMYDFPRDADGNPTWEQAPRPGLDSGLLTVRRPVIEQTFYRIEVSAPETNDPTPELVTVTFTVVDNYGGTLVAYVGADRFAAGSQIEVGSDVEFIATPADGYRVREWRVNGEIANSLARVGNVLLIENISANTSVTVAFEEIPVVPVIRTVTFIRNHDANDNTVIVTRDVEVGETLALPPAPTRAGHEFLGWFTARVGGTEFTATTVVTADLNVYARWRPTGGGIVACPPGAPGCPPEPGQPGQGQPGPSGPSLPQTGTSAIQTGLIGASILASGMIATYVKNKKKQQKRI